MFRGGRWGWVEWLVSGLWGGAGVWEVVVALWLRWGVSDPIKWWELKRGTHSTSKSKGAGCFDGPRGSRPLLPHTPQKTPSALGRRSNATRETFQLPRCAPPITVYAGGTEGWQKPRGKLRGGRLGWVEWMKSRRGCGWVRRNRGSRAHPEDSRSSPRPPRVAFVQCYTALCPHVSPPRM